MIDLIAYKQYQEFLKSIKTAKQHHYIFEDSAWHNKEDGINCAKELGYDYFSMQADDRYVGYKGNFHHPKTSFVWNKIFPRFAQDFKLNLVPRRFSKSNYCDPSGKYDLSFHTPITNGEFIIQELGTDKILKGKHEDVLRSVTNKNMYGGYTEYHSLFKLYHRCAKIDNLTSTSGRTLLLNVDSTSIPLIPLAACFFRTVYILDNRAGGENLKYIPLDTVTDYCAIGLTRNWCYDKIFHSNPKNKVCLNKIFSQNIK